MRTADIEVGKTYVVFQELKYSDPIRLKGEVVETGARRYASPGGWGRTLDDNGVVVRVLDWKHATMEAERAARRSGTTIQVALERKDESEGPFYRGYERYRRAEDSDLLVVMPRAILEPWTPEVDQRIEEAEREAAEHERLRKERVRESEAHVRRVTQALRERGVDLPDFRAGSVSRTGSIGDFRLDIEEVEKLLGVADG